jgi:hypothetical protein
VENSGVTRYSVATGVPSKLACWGGKPELANARTRYLLAAMPQVYAKTAFERTQSTLDGNAFSKDRLSG